MPVLQLAMVSGVIFVPDHNPGFKVIFFFFALILERQTDQLSKYILPM